MTYINAEYNYKAKKVIVWERNEEGKRIVKFHEPEWYFYVETNSDDYDEYYKGMFGEKLKRVDCSTQKELIGKVLRYKEYNQKTFESDIAQELKILSKNYYKAKLPNLEILFYDIEVDYDPKKGFSAPGNAYAPLNAVALYDTIKDTIFCIAVPPPEEDITSLQNNKEEFIKNLNAIEPLEKKLELSFVSTEKELLLEMLDVIEDADIFLGWNSDTFDNPYIAERILITLDGKTQEEINERAIDDDGNITRNYKNNFTNAHYFNRLSFDAAKTPTRKMVEVYGEPRPTLKTSGRISTDYLELYKKFTFGEKPSYKLESIAEIELPEMRKLDYEGTLHDLYHNDFCKFVRYNIRDTEILYAFENKLGFIALANTMYHDTTGVFDHILSTLKNTELAMINYCHYVMDDIKVPDMKKATTKGRIDGAYVLPPKVGLHKMLASIDMTSLYPSSIISNNISPETLVGQFKNNKSDFQEIKNRSNKTLSLIIDGGETYKKTAIEWAKWLESANCSISGYGTVFNLKNKGILPGLLEMWFANRKENKKESFTNAKLAEQETDPNKKHEYYELSDYYDRIQQCNKLALNSAYGALCNEYFRFYDLRLGASTTATGQELLKHQCAEVNRILRGEYDFLGESIIYGDTDSTYFKTFTDNIEMATKVGDIIGDRVNKSFPEFMKKTFFCSKGYDDKINTDREVIASSGIFVGKKLYIMHITNLEGKVVDKLKVMGLSLKKTTLSKEIQTVLSNIVGRILKDDPWNEIEKDICDFRNELKHTNDISRIGLPIGVKKIEEYTKKYSDGTMISEKIGDFFETDGEIDKKSDANIPGHIAASIHWNLALKEYDDKESMEITSGSKIKVYYLKKNYYNDKFKSIAIPVDNKTIPEWFIKYYQPHIDIEAQMERLVYKPLENIFNAIGKEIISEEDESINELFEF